MTFIEVIEFLARFVWPPVLAWNIYLFRYSRAQEKALDAYKLYVAENYLSKADLVTMFTGFETRMEKRLVEKFEMLKELISK